MRTCVGCRRRGGPDGLVRLVRLPDGSLGIGRTAPGRGAWLCPDVACFDAARKRRAFDRALRGAVSDASVTAVRARMEEAVREGRA
ncbi:MAG: YlxR family protein [Acidimicrobiia bacterium]